MATQLKYTDFAYTPAPMPCPNIRVAFIAGEAATAVHDAMAKLPANTRDGTLEDLVWDQGVAAAEDEALIQSMTCSLIEKARELLSPRMYTAFLRWGETASHASSFYESDEEGAARCKDSGEALRSVATAPADNAHDMMFRALLAGIEAADCSGFGPFEIESAENGFPLEDLAKGLSVDLSSFSPIAGLFAELSTRAWALSKSKGAFSLPIGGAITSAFSFARGEDSTDRGGRTLASLDGYNRYMRGPLIQWQRAYDQYVEIKTEAEQYYKDVVLPADARFRLVRDKLPADYNFENDPVARAECDLAHYEEIEKRGDALWDQEHDARVRLYLIPAPSEAELAVKLKLFSENRDSDLTRRNDIVEQMMFDARRFGRHGAHLQTDKALLTAYAGLRSSATDWYAHGARNDERDEARNATVLHLEEVVWKNRATTLEGVLARLRVTFKHISGEAWSDRALVDPTHAEFRAGLANAGGNDQMLWSAIEDLARIAGVSLAEQGA
ncbi:hypothetical protein QP175_05810 [Sphingomonas aerolata]|uniref:hypothetical protein n=1 Tax=Sphingomonas aerolata TaxID=185951 RepID=UPI002FE115ED